MEKTLITGNEAAVLGAIDAGAEIMFGYPITPATEILQGWITKACAPDSGLKYLQTEDEIACGFGTIGAILGGKKAFTASAGPGHILLQDPISMAENLRIPFVGIMMQRGGPSTGTVNFSQQEVNLAAFGGNGDGLRIVYSASSVEDMYDLTAKAFSTAWKYRFPTFVLGDGYLGKMKQTVALKKHLNSVAAEPILKESIKEPVHLRNCYSTEESLGERLDESIADWKDMSGKVVESEKHFVEGAKVLIVAHGLVANAAKEAVTVLHKEGKKVGIFRPITINPFDEKGLRESLSGVEKVVIIESAKDQFARIVKYNASGVKVKFIEYSKPAQGFTPQEIINFMRKEYE